MSVFDQSDYAVRCAWGLNGLRAIIAQSGAVIIVDVLSFSTCVDIAVGRGAVILPYRSKDNAATDYARSMNAALAGPRSRTELSLSPASMHAIAAETRCVLPSPNGATLAFEAGAAATFAGCLRNASAVARAANHTGDSVTVIAAGEQWPDGSLRPCLEDWLGAGAIIHALGGTRSPEARAAEATFCAMRNDLAGALTECASGRELIERGFLDDIDLAAAYDCSDTAPVLINGEFQPGA